MLPLSAPFGNIHFLSEPEEKSGFANDLKCGTIKITYKLGTRPRIGAPWISRMRGSYWIGNSSGGGNQMNLHEEKSFAGVFAFPKGRYRSIGRPQ